MTVSRYFRLFALVPVLLHTSAAAISRSEVYPKPGMVRESIDLFALSAAGLLVYVPFAIAVGWYTFHFSGAELRRFSYIAPVLFALAFFFAAPVLGVKPGSVLTMALLATGWGYFYVGIMLGSARALRSVGVLNLDESPSAG